MSDPGKEIDQLVLEMEDQLKKARGEVQSTMALEKRQRQKREALAKSVERMGERGPSAPCMRATTAWPRRRSSASRDRRRARRRPQRRSHEQRSYAEELTAALKALDVRVNEVKMRKETLKAQARAQKSRDSGTGPTEAFERFDKLSTDVDVKEAELASTTSWPRPRHTDAKSLEVERKLDELGKNTRARRSPGGAQGQDGEEGRLALLRRRRDF